MNIFGYNAAADQASAAAHVNGWWNAHFDERGRCKFIDAELREHEQMRERYIAVMTRCARLDFAAIIVSSLAILPLLFTVGGGVSMTAAAVLLLVRLIWSGAARTGLFTQPQPFPALFMSQQIIARMEAGMARFILLFWLAIYGGASAIWIAAMII